MRLRVETRQDETRDEEDELVARREHWNQKSARLLAQWPRRVRAFGDEMEIRWRRKRKGKRGRDKIIKIKAVGLRRHRPMDQHQ